MSKSDRSLFKRTFEHNKELYQSLEAVLNSAINATIQSPKYEDSGMNLVKIGMTTSPTHNEEMKRVLKTIFKALKT